MRTWIALVLALTATLAQAQSDTNQIMGILGYPVGTELTIEGRYYAGKNQWLNVTKVNGKDLASPILIATDNLHPHSPAQPLPPPHQAIATL